MARIELANSPQLTKSQRLELSDVEPAIYYLAPFAAIPSCLSFASSHAVYTATLTGNALDCFSGAVTTFLIGLTIGNGTGSRMNRHTVRLLMLIHLGLALISLLAPPGLLQLLGNPLVAMAASFAVSFSLGFFCGLLTRPIRELLDTPHGPSSTLLGFLFVLSSGGLAAASFSKEIGFMRFAWTVGVVQASLGILMAVMSRNNVKRPIVFLLPLGAVLIALCLAVCFEPAIQDYCLRRWLEK